MQPKKPTKTTGGVVCGFPGGRLHFVLLVLPKIALFFQKVYLGFLVGWIFSTRPPRAKGTQPGISRGTTGKLAALIVVPVL